MRVIAIDGPAASGKSSTGARVAERLGWAHLDSGALYRAMTLAALDNLGEEGGGKGEGWSAQRIVALAQELPIALALVGREFTPTVAGVDVEEAVRSERVTARVSAVAALPEVRAWVNAEQRRAVARHPAGVVVDGRDIGTVVFPDADLKFYLDASDEERGLRRYRQLRGRGEPAVLAEIVAEIEERDRRDRSRAHSPLRCAPDAERVDTTLLSMEEVVALLLERCRQRLRRPQKP